MSNFPTICHACKRDFDVMVDGSTEYRGGIGFCHHPAAGNTAAAGTYYCVIPLHGGSFQTHVVGPLALAEAEQMAQEHKKVSEGDDTLQETLQ